MNEFIFFGVVFLVLMWTVLGGWIARHNQADPILGSVLGLCLGPIGLIIAALLKDRYR